MNDLLEFRLLSAKLKLKYILDPKMETKRSNIPAPMKSLVWRKYVSNELIRGSCFCCRVKKITLDDFQCSHIISDKDGGKVEIENLRACCGKCNQSMNSRNMYEYISNYGFWN